MLPLSLLNGALGLAHATAFVQSADYVRPVLPAALAKALPKQIRPMAVRRAYSGADLKASGRSPGTPTRRSHRLSNE